MSYRLDIEEQVEYGAKIPLFLITTEGMPTVTGMGYGLRKALDSWLEQLEWYNATVMGEAAK